jgi:uncharacterized phage-associated protein
MALSENLDKLQQTLIQIHRAVFAESPSPMKLQKLCYYAQGYMLAGGKDLFPEDFQAWQHGPVIPELYQKYSSYSWRAIDVDLPAEVEDKALEADVADIVAAYGRYDGAALSTMTHREAPWLDARGGIPESQGSSAVISKEALSRFFQAQLRQDGAGK